MDLRCIGAALWLGMAACAIDGSGSSGLGGPASAAGHAPTTPTGEDSSAVSSGADPITSPPATDSVPAPQCIADPGATQQDIDAADSPPTLFHRPAGMKLVIQFQKDGLPDRYWPDVTSAAAAWSKSPCIQADAVSRCDRGANCVRVRDQKSSEEGDGAWSGPQGRVTQTKDGVTLDFDAKLFEKASETVVLATITHGMGRVFGLALRLHEGDVMHHAISDATNPIPDAIDYANLAVIFGKAQ